MAERVFADLTIEALAERLDGLTDVQANAVFRLREGQWIQAICKIDNVTESFGDLFVSFRINQQHVFAHFSKGDARARALGKDDIATVQGKISAAHGADLSLVDCEIISVVTAQELALADRREANKELSHAVQDLLTRQRTADDGWNGLVNNLNQVPPQYAEAAPGADEQNEADAHIPSVDYEHLKLWYVAFESAYPNGSEELALKSARGTFPEHFVRRQWVRDLRGERPMGRPRKNNGK